MFSDGHLDHFAPQATPELQELFSEWLRATEDRVLDLIVKKTTDTAAIAAVLKLSEPSVRYILNPPRRSRQDHTERGSGKVGGIFHLGEPNGLDCIGRNAQPRLGSTHAHRSLFAPAQCRRRVT